MQDHSISRVPLQLVRNCAVASIQVDLSEEVLSQFRTDLLAMLERTNAASVILDVSGVELMDLVEFDALRQTVSMAQLMGARTVFSGFQPGVVSALVELDAEICSIDAALNLDAAFDILETEVDAASDPEFEAETATDADSGSTHNANEELPAGAADYEWDTDGG